MATKYYAVLTNVGAAKLANATALGAQVEITQMAVGDGNGVLTVPDPAQTSLAHELRRAPLNTLTIDPDHANQIVAEQVIPAEAGGWWIREMGLFDKSGDMVAVANCAETYKPLLQEGSGRVQVIRMILIVNSTEAVTLNIDPTVALATRQYVEEKVTEVRGDADGLFLRKDANLSDVKDVAKSRASLGLKGAATLNVGTAAGTVAAGNDTRIVNALQKGANLSELTSPVDARKNLGLGDLATKDKLSSTLWGNNFDGSGSVDGTLTVKGNDADNAFFKLIQAATTTDGGYLAVGNSGRDKGYVEIGTIDDGDTGVYARKRKNDGSILSSVTLLDESNNSSFPGKVSLPQTSSFGVNTTNALGGSSIAIGDTDTGLRQNGDGKLDVYANNQQVFRFEPNSVTNFREQAYYSPGAPVGSGAFADQLTNATAPFVQKSWNWTPGNGGHFVPLVKGLSNRTNIGYPSAVSFGYLLTDNNGFAIPAIHVRGDNSFDALWQFNPNDKTLYCPGNVHAGGAVYQDNGNLSGSVWGGYLSDWLNNQFRSRDDNINNRATWDYVNNDNTPTTNAANRGAIDQRINWYRDSGYMDQRIEWWCQARNPGDFGSYALLTTTEDNVRPGSIRGGLHYADGADQAWGDAPGNWRLMGNISGIGSSGGSVSIWLRVY